MDALAYIYPYLRNEDDFWSGLPANDAYVAPHDNYVVYDEEGFEFKPFRRIHSEHYAKLMKKGQTVLPNKSVRIE